MPTPYTTESLQYMEDSLHGISEMVNSAGTAPTLNDCIRIKAALNEVRGAAGAMSALYTRRMLDLMKASHDNAITQKTEAVNDYE